MSPISVRTGKDTGTCMHLNTQSNF